MSSERTSALQKEEFNIRIPKNSPNLSSYLPSHPKSPFPFLLPALGNVHLVSMLNALRTVILPPIEDARPLSAGYEAIGAEEDGPVERNKGDEGGVYWCFWVLGAGVLLSWNGG